MRFYLSIILLLILVFIAFIFGSQNNQTIELSYMIARTEMSIATAVAIFTGLGFVIGIVMMSVLLLFKRVTKKKIPTRISSDNV